MPVQPAEFSGWTFAVLSVVLLASLGVLLRLMRRWTVGRQAERVADWASRHGLTAAFAVPGCVPATSAGLEPRTVYVSEGLVVARLRSARTPGAREAHKPSMWHVLGVRLEVPVSEGVLALRSAVGGPTVVDLYTVGVAGSGFPRPAGTPAGAGAGLTSLPSLETPESHVPFATCGTPSTPLTAWAKSLPHDLSVITTGEGWLLVDFTSRPLTDRTLDEVLRAARELAGTSPVRA